MMIYFQVFSILILLVIIVQTSIVPGHIVNVVFIVDNSARTTNLLLHNELILIPRIISRISHRHEKIRFGIITYSKDAKLIVGFGNIERNEALLQSLWQMRHSGSERTNLCYALKLARTYLFEEMPGQKKFVILFPNTMWDRPKSANIEFNHLKQMDVQILIVAIGNSINRKFVSNFTDNTAIIYKPHITLNFIQEKIIYNFIVNNIYRKSVSNPTTATNTPRSIYYTTSSVNKSTLQANLYSEVSSNIIIVTKLPLEITTVTTDNRVPIRPFPCKMHGRMAFLIDATSNVSSFDFYKMLDACLEIIYSMLKASLKISFAIITFGSETIINMTFENYEIIKDISQFIKNIKPQGGESGLGAALSIINNRIFNDPKEDGQNFYLMMFSASKHVIGPDPIIINNDMFNTGRINIFNIFIGNKSNTWVDAQLLGRDSFKIHKFDDLQKSVFNISNKICSDLHFE